MPFVFHKFKGPSIARHYACEARQGGGIHGCVCTGACTGCPLWTRLRAQGKLRSFHSPVLVPSSLAFNKIQVCVQVLDADAPAIASALPAVPQTVLEGWHGTGKGIQLRLNDKQSKYDQSKFYVLTGWSTLSDSFDMPELSNLAQYMDQYKALPKDERDGEPAKRLFQLCTFLSDSLTAFILHVAAVLRSPVGLSARRSISSNATNFSPPEDAALLNSYGPKLGEFLIFFLRVLKLDSLPANFPPLDTEHGNLVKAALEGVASDAEECFVQHRELAQYTRPKMPSRAERVQYLTEHKPERLWSSLHRLFGHLYFHDMGRYIFKGVWCLFLNHRFCLTQNHKRTYSTGLSVLSNPAT